MRTLIRRPSVLALALAFGLGAAAAVPPSADAADDKGMQEKTNDAYGSFLDYSHEQKDEAVGWADRQLAAIEARIDEMERNWNKSESKADLDALRANLAEKRAEAENELEDLGKAGEGAWQDAKVETRDALGALERAYQDTRRRIAD